MNTCAHSNLIQLSQPKKKLRCQRCHLTITADELKQGFCPECFERNGDKHYDFEEIEFTKPVSIQYKCEDCGVIIEGD